MIAWWWLGFALASDVPALRLLDAEDRSAAVDLAPDRISMAVDLGPDVGWVAVRGAWVGGSVGRSWALTGADRTWGIDATAAGGVGVLLATPGAALTGLGALSGGARSERGLLTLGLVVPPALRVAARPELVLPVGLELLAGLRLGEVWVGGRAQAGATLQVDGPPAGRAGASAWLRIPLGR